MTRVLGGSITLLKCCFSFKIFLTDDALVPYRLAVSFTACIRKKRLLLFCKMLYDSGCPFFKFHNHCYYPNFVRMLTFDSLSFKSSRSALAESKTRRIANFSSFLIGLPCGLVVRSAIVFSRVGATDLKL